MIHVMVSETGSKATCRRSARGGRGEVHEPKKVDDDDDDKGRNVAGLVTASTKTSEDGNTKDDEGGRLNANGDADEDIVGSSSQ